MPFLVPFWKCRGLLLLIFFANSSLTVVLSSVPFPPSPPPSWAFSLASSLFCHPASASSSSARTILLVPALSFCPGALSFCWLLLFFSPPSAPQSPQPRFGRSMTCSAARTRRWRGERERAPPPAHNGEPPQPDARPTGESVVQNGSGTRAEEAGDGGAESE